MKKVEIPMDSSSNESMLFDIYNKMVDVINTLNNKCNIVAELCIHKDKRYDPVMNQPMPSQEAIPVWCEHLIWKPKTEHRTYDCWGFIPTPTSYWQNIADKWACCPICKAERPKQIDLDAMQFSAKTQDCGCPVEYPCSGAHSKPDYIEKPIDKCPSCGLADCVHWELDKKKVHGVCRAYEEGSYSSCRKCEFCGEHYTTALCPCLVEAEEEAKEHMGYKRDFHKCRYIKWNDTTGYFWECDCGRRKYQKTDPNEE